MMNQYSLPISFLCATTLLLLFSQVNVSNALSSHDPVKLHNKSRQRGRRRQLMMGMMGQRRREGRSLFAKITRYPGFEEETAPFGFVQVAHEPASTPHTFLYHLYGVPPNCINCGVHIHTGTTCDDPSLVGGHYWREDVLEVDPWTTAGGAVYNSDIYGRAVGGFQIDSGFSFFDNINHAVVFHAEDGTRIGCGILLTRRNFFNTNHLLLGSL